jgi:hypothetical protein
MTLTTRTDDKVMLFQLITSLVPAGAERLVVHLLEYIDRERFAPVCICLATLSARIWRRACSS